MTIEASWVHMSHATFFGDQNPGIDNIGARLSFSSSYRHRLSWGAAPWVSLNGPARSRPQAFTRQGQVLLDRKSGVMSRDAT